MATATREENDQLNQYKQQLANASIAQNDSNQNNNIDLNVCVELDHTIGFSIVSTNPLHFLEKPQPDSPININNDKQLATIQQSNNNQKQNNNDNENNSQQDLSNFDYCNIAGSSILFNKFNDPQNQLFLNGHTDIIVACDMSKNKELIATGQCGITPDIYVWNIKLQKIIYKFEEHTYGVQHLSFSDDSRFLASVGTIKDNKFYIWDMNTGNIVSKDIIRPSPINDIKWGGRVKDIKNRDTKNYLFATCGNNEVRIWALSPNNGTLYSEKCNTISYLRNYICMEFSYKNDLLIVGTLSSDFLIFNVKKLSVIANYETCASGVTNICVMPMIEINPNIINESLNKEYFIKIYIGGGDGTITLWEYHDDQQTFLEKEKYYVNGKIISLETNYDFTKILCGTNTGYIYEIIDKKYHTPTVTAQSQSPLNGIMDNNNNINEINQINKQMKNFTFNENDVSKSNEKENNINNNDKTKGNKIKSLDGFKKMDYQGILSCLSINETMPIIGVKFAETESNNFISVTNKGSIRKWKINNYTIELSHPYCKENRLLSTSFDLNNEIIIVGWNDGYLRIYNMHKSNSFLWDIKDAHKSGVSCVKMSHNQKYIASGGIDGSLRIWDVRFRNIVCQFKEHTNTINGIIIYTDNRHALTCSRDRSFICWDLGNQQRISCHRQQFGGINDIILSKDQQIVITVGSDKCISFWDLRQKNSINIINNAHNNDINCIKLSHSGNIISTAGKDCVIKLWDIRNFKNFKNLTSQPAHFSGINDIAFSYDDKQLVSAGQDATIKLWNIYQM